LSKKDLDNPKRRAKNIANGSEAGGEPSREIFVETRGAA
jgi:hypothetical protein